MSHLGKLIVLVGVLLAFMDLLIWGAGKWEFRGLPSDMRFEGGNFGFYLPGGNCLVLSPLLTAACWIVLCGWRWWRR